MKIAGVETKNLTCEDVLVLPRGESDTIIFKATSIKNYDEFDALCPEPKVPLRRTRDGVEADVENVDYQAMVAEYGKRKVGFVITRSLLPSEIEWDTVDFNSPGTWPNWSKDLTEGAGLSQAEANLVFQLVWQVNALDETKLKKARALFLQGPLPAPPQ